MSYKYLRYIYLSSNQISEIAPLGGIDQMLTLTLDRNKIEQFNLPKMKYLQDRDNFHGDFASKLAYFVVKIHLFNYFRTKIVILES